MKQEHWTMTVNCVGNSLLANTNQSAAKGFGRSPLIIKIWNPQTEEEEARQFIPVTIDKYDDHAVITIREIAPGSIIKTVYDK